MVWFDKDMIWFAPATGKRGSQPIGFDAAIPFCLTIKCQFVPALRQTISMVESLLRLANRDWMVPDFSTLSRRQKDLQICISVRQQQDCLHLVVDSTGIKMVGEGELKVGRTLWKKWSRYHRRSLMETKMHCFKRLADRVMMSLDFDRQVAGFQICAVTLDRFTSLGMPQTMWMG